MSSGYVGGGGAAVGGALGGIIGGIASAQAAAKQRQFIKQMYQNRYQYTVNDMRAAGLNPMLAANFGGATAPAGSQAQVPNYGEIGLGIEKSYREGRMQHHTRKTAEAQANSAVSQSRITENQAILSDRDRALGTSSHGIAAARARLAPEGTVGRTLFGFDRLLEAGRNWLDGSGKGVKQPVRRRPPIRINKWGNK